jgi:hypothetical protein
LLVGLRFKGEVIFDCYRNVAIRKRKSASKSLERDASYLVISSNLVEETVQFVCDQSPYQADCLQSGGSENAEFVAAA